MAKDPRNRKTSILRGLSFVAVVAAVVVVWVVVDPVELVAAESEEVVATSRETAELRRSDLVETTSVEGSLVFADVLTVQHSGTGVVTALAKPGIVVATGTELYAVDNVPVVALPGAVPAWRTMEVDVVGEDVRQLELALVEMGYDTLGVMTVDDTYTDYTADLVSLWQADMGAEETGTVEFGAVVFVGEGQIVGSVAAEVGQAPPADGVLVLRSSDRKVEFVSDSWVALEVGDVVTGQLPDRTEIELTIVGVESGDAGWTYTAEAGTGTDALGAVEEVPIDVSWDVSLGSGLLVAPSSAVRRLDSQVHALEVVIGGDPSNTEFVPVEIGEISGGWVEVAGDVDEGTTVIAP